MIDKVECRITVMVAIFRSSANHHLESVRSSFCWSSKLMLSIVPSRRPIVFLVQFSPPHRFNFGGFLQNPICKTINSFWKMGNKVRLSFCILPKSKLVEDMYLYICRYDCAYFLYIFEYCQFTMKPKLTPSEFKICGSGIKMVAVAAQERCMTSAFARRLSFDLQMKM